MKSWVKRFVGWKSKPVPAPTQRHRWLQHTPEGKSIAVLENDPPYCHGLQQAPEVMEPALQEGVWLVMMAAVWSGPDIEAIPTAVTIVQEFGGRVRLGVRPLNDHEETCKWCPSVPRFYATPLWLVFRQGQLIDQAGGGRSREQVRAMIERGLSM